MAGDDGLDLVVLLVPRRHDVPAQAVVDRQVRARAPAVLREDAAVLIAKIEDAAGRLNVVARHAEQEVGEVRTGFGAGKRERAVERRVRLQPHLLELILPAELHSVPAPHPRNAVRQMERIARLIDACNRHAHRERVEHEILDTFELWRQHDDARRAGTGDESLRREAHALAAVRHAHVVCVVREAGVEGVHRVRSECSRASKRPELRAADRERIEARHVRATLLAGVRIVERIVVDEVVARQQSEQPRVAVEPDRAFIVANRLRKRARRQRVRAGIGRRHVLQQLLCRRRPRP